MSCMPQVAQSASCMWHASDREGAQRTVTEQEGERRAVISQGKGVAVGDDTGHNTSKKGLPLLAYVIRCGERNISTTTAKGKNS